MSEKIKDFTPLYSYEKTAVQFPEVKQNIASLLTLLNTHQLLNDGGIQLYEEKEGHKQIDLAEAIGYDILNNVDLSFFIKKTLVDMADEAYGKGNDLFEFAEVLRDYEPNNPEKSKALEDTWNKHKEVIENMIYLYSEYLYKVFLDNPYKKHL